MKKIYKKYIKRILDIILSAFAIIVLLPFLLFFVILGTIKMRGNPFFVQERPGKDGKIFKLIKFRTMNNAKDKKGKLLPDLQRLTRYGKFLRNSSIDELPELFNIFKGDMSFVGPRPLLVKYLPLYDEKQMHRHDVKPGLTGHAQVYGRNSLKWEERFELDIFYVKNVTFIGDLKIIFRTAKIVFCKKDIDTNKTKKYTMMEFTGTKEE